MTSVNTPIPFEDWLLKLPKKIDLISYRGGTGGQFFTSLVALSSYKTRNLLRTDNFILNELEDQSTVASYSNAKYHLKNINSFIDYTNHMMTSEELIRNFKSSLFNSMMNYYIDQCKASKFDQYPIKTIDSNLIKKRLTTLYSGSILMLRSHFYMFSDSSVDALNSSNIWGVLNIDPITKQGKNCAINSYKSIFPEKNYDYTNWFDYTYKDSERFPFFDFLLYEDYDEIKYFLENRYGKDLDFDFIDKSLKDYYKRRVAPFVQ